MLEVQLKEEGYVLGRVLLEHQRLYRVITRQGEVLASISGKFRYEAIRRTDYPCVGDWIALVVREQEQRGTIHRVLPRSSRFSRKAAGTGHDEQLVATNVDTVFLVHALNQDFNIRRLERYLVMAWESGASPVIVLNKSDLCDQAEARRAEVETIALGVPIHTISAEKNMGLEELAPYLQSGKTVALLGSSGVGKSTLTNKLTGKKRQMTQSVREQDGKGRHTTTYRELIPLPGGGCIIDTPGMRELQLWDAPDGLNETFGDIDTLAEQCRFNDCTHLREPGCAVQAALTEGKLSRERFDSYCKLQRELAYLTRKENKQSQLAEKALWKKRTIQTKKHPKRR
nr:ribosome small subunit-dependent GTPase A [Paenactinomyces guangxiensis]